VTALVVGGDGYIDVLGGRVSVTEGLSLSVSDRHTFTSSSTHNDRDVDVGSFLDSLSVGAGVGDNNQARLLERAGDVIGEVTGGETTSNGDGTGVRGELENSTLTVGTSRDDADCRV
jgi:hypothetical protein